MALSLFFVYASLYLICAAEKKSNQPKKTNLMKFYI